MRGQDGLCSVKSGARCLPELQLSDGRSPRYEGCGEQKRVPTERGAVSPRALLSFREAAHSRQLEQPTMKRISPSFMSQLLQGRISTNHVTWLWLSSPRFLSLTVSTMSASGHTVACLLGAVVDPQHHSSQRTGNHTHIMFPEFCLLQLNYVLFVLRFPNIEQNILFLVRTWLNEVLNPSLG